MCLRVHLF